jgi:hypothetical protein
MATTSAPVSPQRNEAHSNTRIEVDETLQRVMAEGRVRLQNELVRLQALGIIDENGKLLKTDLPPDMRPGADRDFAG